VTSSTQLGHLHCKLFEDIASQAPRLSVLSRSCRGAKDLNTEDVSVVVDGDGPQADAHDKLAHVRRSRQDEPIIMLIIINPRAVHLSGCSMRYNPMQMPYELLELLQRIRPLATPASTSCTTATSSTPSTATVLLPERHVSFHRLVPRQSCNTRHQIRWNMLHVRLDPCWVQRRIVAEIREIKRVGGKVGLKGCQRAVRK
jgi:hypothetical protein